MAHDNYEALPTVQKLTTIVGTLQKRGVGGMYIFDHADLGETVMPVAKADAADLIETNTRQLIPAPVSGEAVYYFCRQNETVKFVFAEKAI